MPLLGFRAPAPGHHLFPPLSSLPLGGGGGAGLSSLPLAPTGLSSGLSHGFQRPPAFASGGTSPPLRLGGCAVPVGELSPMTLAERERQGEFLSEIPDPPLRNISPLQSPVVMGRRDHPALRPHRRRRQSPHAPRQPRCHRKLSHKHSLHHLLLRQGEEKI